MTAWLDDAWIQANQRFLVAALKRTSSLLERHASRPDVGGRELPVDLEWESLRRIMDDMSAPPALERVRTSFGLSPFEVDVLLLCAGMELDGSFASRCAAANGDAGKPFPTFGLSLAALPDAHWSAVTPAAPLRYWRLVEIAPGQGLTSSALRIDETVLHYLTGAPHLDDRLQGMMYPVAEAFELSPSQALLVQRTKDAWADLEFGARQPVIQLCGKDRATVRAVASASCQALSVGLHGLSQTDVPSTSSDRETLARLWSRHSILHRSVLLLECHDSDNPEATNTLQSFAERLDAPLMLASRDPLALRDRNSISLDVSAPPADEQAELWREALGEAATAVEPEIDSVAGHFRVNWPAMKGTARDVRRGRLS